jgi:serine phosphatase RsbU (regulator of sigma subunit)
MGRTRSTLRAYALLGGPLVEVLERTDRKLQHFEPGVIVTVICATALPPYDRFTISSAGHPPPVKGTSTEVRLVEMEVDPPLGVGSGMQRGTSIVPLGSGDMVAFYTDGLIERRGESLDQGLSRLVDALGDAGQLGSADAVCARVMQMLVGGAVAPDDMALLVAQRL